MLKLCSLFLLGFFLTGTNADSKACSCACAKDIHAESKNHTDKITGMPSFPIGGIIGALAKIKKANITTAVFEHVKGTNNTVLVGLGVDMEADIVLVGTVQLSANASVIANWEITDGCKQLTPDMNSLNLAVGMKSSSVPLLQEVINFVVKAVAVALKAVIKLIYTLIFIAFNGKRTAFKDEYYVDGKPTHCEVTDSKTEGKDVKSNIKYVQNGREHTSPPYEVTRLDDESHCTGLPGATMDFLMFYINGQHEVVIPAAIASAWGFVAVITGDVRLIFGLKGPMTCKTPKGSHSVNVAVAAALWVDDKEIVKLEGTAELAVNTVHENGCMGYQFEAGAAIGLSVTSTHADCSCDGAQNKLQSHLDAGAKVFLGVINGKMGCFAKTKSPDTDQGKEKPCEQLEGGCKCGYANI